MLVQQYCVFTYCVFTISCMLVTETTLVKRMFSAAKQFTAENCYAIYETNKKAQQTLSNPRDVKACQNCSNSTCFVSFHRIPFTQIANA